MNGNFYRLEDFANAAKNKLDSKIYDYFVGGAGDEITVHRNIQALDEISILPRFLRDVSICDLNTSILGMKLSMPVMIAPMASHCLAHPEGEFATIKGASKANVLTSISTISSRSLEEISQQSEHPLWFQLYVHKDRAYTKELIERAERAGYKAIILTVDVPIMGRRYRDIRNQFTLPKSNNIKDYNKSEENEVLPISNNCGLKHYTDTNFDRSFTWNDLGWLVSMTELPIIVKGIMRKDDANRAIEIGASAIIVSNHGGRQLDTVASTIDVLPSIVNATQKKIPILIDGGFYRGTDIFKALALGADCVAIGRPILWGLAHNGADGVYTVLELLRTELMETMILSGYSTIEEIKHEGVQAIMFHTKHKG